MGEEAPRFRNRFEERDHCRVGPRQVPQRFDVVRVGKKPDVKYHVRVQRKPVFVPERDDGDVKLALPRLLGKLISDASAKLMAGQQTRIPDSLGAIAKLRKCGTLDR